MVSGRILSFSQLCLLVIIGFLLIFQGNSMVFGATGSGLINDTTQDMSNGSAIYSKADSRITLIINPLPQLLAETSGLIYYNGGLWTHNDSGGLPEIYKIDTITGEIVQTIGLSGAANTDWEDIAQDDSFIYIGDFGNNAGNRSDLRIYCVAKNQIPAKVDTSISALLIQFTYSDQSNFEEAFNNNNYDCEAMICAGDSLYLFSKRWIDHKSMMYVLPKFPGTFVAQVRDSLAADGLITGADYSEKYGEVALIGYNRYKPLVWLLFDFQGLNFLKGKKHKIKFPCRVGAQTEGIAYTFGRNIFISAEKTNVYSQRAYKLNTARWTHNKTTGLNNINYQNPTNEQ